MSLFTLLEFLNESLDVNEGLVSMFTGKYSIKEFIEKINDAFNKGLKVKYKRYFEIKKKIEDVTIDHFIDVELFTDEYIINKDGTKETYEQKAKRLNEGSTFGTTYTAKNLKKAFDEYAKRKEYNDINKSKITVIAYTINLLVPIGLIEKSYKDKSDMKDVKAKLSMVYYGQSLGFKDGLDVEDKIEKKFIVSIITPLKRFFKDPEGRSEDIDFPYDNIQDKDAILNNFVEYCPKELQNKILNLKA